MFKRNLIGTTHFKKNTDKQHSIDKIKKDMLFKQQNKIHPGTHLHYFPYLFFTNHHQILIFSHKYSAIWITEVFAIIIALFFWEGYLMAKVGFLPSNPKISIITSIWFNLLYSRHLHYQTTMLPRQTYAIIDLFFCACLCTDFHFLEIHQQ